MQRPTWHGDAGEGCVVPGVWLQEGGKAGIVLLIQLPALGVAAVCSDEQVVRKGLCGAIRCLEDCLLLFPVHAVDAALEM